MAEDRRLANRSLILRQQNWLIPDRHRLAAQLRFRPGQVGLMSVFCVVGVIRRAATLAAAGLRRVPYSKAAADRAGIDFAAFGAWTGRISKQPARYHVPGRA